MTEYKQEDIPDISETINKALDMAFNTAIDHAGSVVEEFYQSMVLSKTIKEALISKFQALKK